MPDAGAPISNVSKETLYEFIEREQAIDESIEDAQYTVRNLKKQKKDLRALIKGAGFSLAVFDETRAKMALSHEEREANDRELRRNLAWMGMPLGTQAEMFSQEETAVPPEIQISRVKDAGRTAGKLGRERGANPWPAGGLLFSVWDEAWHVGREEAAQSTVPAAPKRGPGRPRKEATAAPAKVNGEGRGKGKKTAVPAEPEAAQPSAPSDLDFDTDTAGSA